MGARAAEFASREFNLGITVTRYATVYEQLLKGSARGCMQINDDGLAKIHCERELYHRDASLIGD